MKFVTLIVIVFCIAFVSAGEADEVEGSQQQQQQLQQQQQDTYMSSNMRFFNPSAIVTSPVLSSEGKPVVDTQAILSRLSSSPLPLPIEQIQHPSLSSKTAKLIAQNMPPQPQAIVHPFSLPVVAPELPENTNWNFVTQPITTKQRTLGRIELAPIMQPYTVSSTTYQRENIKQPITEPVFQPYLQRYIQQAQPEVQPILQRVVQPIVHRELHSFLQTKTEQAPDAATVVKPTQAIVNTNKAIRGSDMAPLPISKTVSNA